MVFWRIIGFATALLFLAMGALTLFVLGIAGLWAGFAQTDFVLKFFALLLYFFGTAALALRFGFKPSRGIGLLLAALVIPSLVYFVLTQPEGQPELREAAEAWVANEDAIEVARAREILVDHGRKAGRYRHIDILMDALEQAETDPERIRMVCMLGQLSYQFPPLLEALRDLRSETAAEPGRAALYEAATQALYQVNPYEGLAPGERRAPQPSLEACLGLAVDDDRS